MCKWNVENYQGGDGRRSPDCTGYRWFWPLQGIHQSGVWRFTAVLTSGELKWMWHKNVCLQDVFLVSNIFCLFYSFQSSVSSFTPTPLPISLSPSSSDTKAGGKVKSSRSRAHYSQIGRAEGNIENEVHCMHDRNLFLNIKMWIFPYWWSEVSQFFLFLSPKSFSVIKLWVLVFFFLCYELFNTLT